MGGFLVIGGWFQVDCSSFDGRFPEESYPIDFGDLVSPPSVGFQHSLLPIGLDDSEMYFGDVLVSDADIGCGIVPNAFDGNVDGFGGDVFDQVMA